MRATRARLWLAALCMVVLAACAGDGGGGKPTVTSLECPQGWIAPESCTWGSIPGIGSGWLVSEQGCTGDMPCAKDEVSRYGSVWFKDDATGKCQRLMTDLSHPNGVAADIDGNVWVATKDGVVVRAAASGVQVAQPIESAGLLNDVTAVPGYAGVVVTDSVTDKVWAVGLDGEALVHGLYGVVPGSPNGIAPSYGDGFAVVGLGDLKLPGAPGAPGGITDVSPDDGHGACAPWHAGAQKGLAAPAGRKLDGIVPATLSGVRGYLVSAIYNIDVGTAKGVDAGLEATLWFIPADGSAAKQVFDGAKHGLLSAADIGRSPDGRVCVPDLNGTTTPTDGATGAKIIIVDGLVK